MSDQYAFYKAGYVRRWHHRPEIQQQTVGQHTFGMLCLLLKLHPNPSSNLMKAIICHDLAESVYGDFSHEAKQALPQLNDIEASLSDTFLKSHGIELDKLDAKDRLWIDYLDQLEVLHYMAFHPDDPEVEVIASAVFSVVSKLHKRLQALGFFLEPEDKLH